MYLKRIIAFGCFLLLFVIVGIVLGVLGPLIKSDTTTIGANENAVIIISQQQFNLACGRIHHLRNYLHSIVVYCPVFILNFCRNYY